MKIKNTICSRCLQIRKIVDGKELRELRISKKLTLR